MTDAQVRLIFARLIDERLKGYADQINRAARLALDVAHPDRTALETLRVTPPGVVKMSDLIWAIRQSRVRLCCRVIPGMIRRFLADIEQVMPKVGAKVAEISLAKTVPGGAQLSALLDLLRKGLDEQQHQRENELQIRAELTDVRREMAEKILARSPSHGTVQKVKSRHASGPKWERKKRKKFSR
jgi:hypothetical protein